MGIKFMGMTGATGAGCGCCATGTCSTTICVADASCSGAAISGATVVIKNGATTIGGCFTAAGTGCCSVAIGTAGTYTVQITKTGYTTYSQSQALTCGGTLNVSLTGNLCPDTTTYPTLHVTDALGTAACVWNPSISQWFGSYTYTPSQGVIRDSTDLSHCDVCQAGAMAITYRVSCVSVSSMTVQRGYNFMGSDPCYYPADNNVHCANSFACVISATATVSICGGAVAWSATIGACPSPAPTPDPVGSGTVTVTS